MRLSLNKTKSETELVSAADATARNLDSPQTRLLVFVAVFALFGVLIMFFARASVLDNIDWQNYGPTDDTYIDEQNPANNAGSEKLLYVSNKAGDCTDQIQCKTLKTQYSYLKFNVNAIPADKQIKRVLLRVHTASHITGSSPRGGSIFTAGNGWNEKELVWNNQPQVSRSSVASLGAVKNGTWYNFELDVNKSGVTSNGTYSFVIKSAIQDAALYHTKESDYRPSLFIVLEPKPVTGPRVYNIPNSIAHLDDCNREMPNVTSEINAWLATVPDGAIARFGAGQCYRSEGTIQIANKKNLTVDGNNAKVQAFTDGCDDQSNDGVAFNNCKYSSPIKNWPRTRASITLKGLSGVILKNLWIDGGYANAGYEGYDSRYEGQAALNFNDDTANDGVTVDGVHIDRVRGDYVYFGSASSQNNVTIKNSFFGDDTAGGKKSGNGRQMVAIVNGTNLRFMNNRFMNSARSGVDIEPLKEASVIKDIYFDDNTFGQARLNWLAMSGYGGVNPVVENIYFRNNKLVGQAFTIDSQTPCTPDPSKPDPSVVECATTPKPTDASTYKRRNFQFINNTSDTFSGNNAGRSAIISGVDGLVIKGNSVIQQVPRDGRSMVFVNVFYSRNVQIIDNKATGSFNKNPGEAGFDATSNIGRYKKNYNICERGNLVSSPLAKDVRPLATTCP